MSTATNHIRGTLARNEHAMKHLIILTLFVFITPGVNGQQIVNREDFEYFLIGTLSDYMGREKYPEVYGKIDGYTPREKALVDYLDSSINLIYSDLDYSIEENERGFKLTSDSLYEIVESFYVYEPGFSRTLSGDTIYRGRINSELLRSKEEKFLFLCGVYVRFGVPNDTGYSIVIHNSLSKIKLCMDLVEELGFTQIKYEIKETIPTAHILQFQPTQEFEDYLSPFIDLRILLNTVFEDFLKEIFGDRGYKRYNRNSH